MAVALALCTTAGFAKSGLELAELCRRAEERAVGVPCGLMDQAASLLGLREHALLLDCGSLEHRHVAFPADLELLIVDSGVARSLDDSPYAERRAEVESGVPKRLHHVRSENERVHEVVAALKTGDREALRSTFAAGHASLRDDFEVSTRELDGLVESALAAGAVAARLTGAGFGGSIVALAERGTGEPVGATVAARHPGSTAYVSRPAGGAADVTSVRPARPEEADAISDLVQRAYGHYVERIGRRPSPMDADYERLATAGELWTLEETAGVVLLREDDGHMLVDNLAVEPKRQGTGLGRRLLEFAEDESRRRGLGELRLYTNLAMTENIALYTRLGWEAFDRRLEGAFCVCTSARPSAPEPRRTRWHPKRTSPRRSGTRSRRASRARACVSVSDKGFFDTFKEAGALAHHLAEAREGHDSQLVNELGHTKTSGFGLTASPSEVTDETLEALSSAVTTLRAKAPDEVDAYRSLVLGVAESVGAAAKGVGPEERAAIDKIQAALDSLPKAPGSRESTRPFAPPSRRRSRSGTRRSATAELVAEPLTRGLPLSPPGITWTAFGSSVRASATKRLAGPLPNMNPFRSTPAGCATTHRPLEAPVGRDSRQARARDRRSRRPSGSRTSRRAGAGRRCGAACPSGSRRGSSSRRTRARTRGSRRGRARLFTAPSTAVSRADRAVEEDEPGGARAVGCEQVPQCGHRLVGVGQERAEPAGAERPVDDRGEHPAAPEAVDRRRDAGVDLGLRRREPDAVESLAS